jgi:putative solute:sodium symporter small subunit
MSQRDEVFQDALPREIDARAAGAILGGWGLLTLVAFSMTDVFAATFLGLPFGAYIAGQGALLGLVIIGLTVSRRLNG